MERNELANPIIFFKGNVHDYELGEFVQLIPKDSTAEVDIVICGDFILECYDGGNLKIPANLWILGETVATDVNCADIWVDGDAYFGKDVDSMEITVARDFQCDKNIDSLDIQVGGDALCKGNVNTNFGEFKVLGNFTCYGNCRSNVAVGGVFLCERTLDGNSTKI